MKKPALQPASRRPKSAYRPHQSHHAVEPHPLPALLTVEQLRPLSLSPRLTHRDIEAIELSLVRCAQSKDEPLAKAAKDILVRAHARAISRWTKRLSLRGARHNLDHDDLHVEVQIGFLRAVKKFDFQAGVKLLTYAAWWFRANARRAIANQGFTIRAPVHAIENRASLRHEDAQATRRVFSLDAPAGDFDDGVTHLDMMVSETPSPEQEAMENIDVRAAKEAVRAALRQLKPREQQAIYGRFIDKRDRCLREIGEEMGISRERVRQIETMALHKLRAILTPQAATVVETLGFNAAGHPRRALKRTYPRKTATAAAA